MKFMRKSGIVRLLVAVLDIKSIPDDAEIAVDDGLYDIYFIVDKVLGDEPKDDFDDADDDLEDGDEEPQEDADIEDAETTQGQIANASTVTGATGSTSQPTPDVMIPSDPTASKVDVAPPTAEERRIVEAAIDLTVHSLLDEISLKVMLEEEESGNIDAQGMDIVCAASTGVVEVADAGDALSLTSHNHSHG